MSRTQRCKICRLNNSEGLPWQLIYWCKQLGKSIKVLFSEKSWMRREKLKSWLLFEKSVLAYTWKSTKEKWDVQVCTVVRVFSWGCELSSLWQVAGYGLAMIVIEYQREKNKTKQNKTKQLETKHELFWTEWCVPSKFTCWSLNSQCNGVWRWHFWR